MKEPCKELANAEYVNQLREVIKLKHLISQMRRNAYFDGKYQKPLDYHKAIADHKTAVAKLHDIQKTISKKKEPFNVVFIRVAREMLSEETFKQIEEEAEKRNVQSSE